MKISITKTHFANPSFWWVMSCHPWFDTWPLEAKTLEEAKAEAILRVSWVIETCVNDIGKFNE